MKLDKDLIEAILTTPSKNTTKLLYGLSTISKYSNIDFHTNEKGEVYYTVPMEKIYNSDITENELTLIKDGNWKIEGDVLKKIL